MSLRIRHHRSPERTTALLTPDGVALGYPWLGNGEAIPGATGQNYTLRSRDVWSRISVRGTRSLADTEPVSLVSGPTAGVRVLQRAEHRRRGAPTGFTALHDNGSDIRSKR